MFSAPDYPQFMADEANRYRNKAAVAILSGPGYDDPNLVQYEAVLPRPEARPYYDLFVNDSDEEFEPVPSTASGMTDVKRGRDGDSEVQGQSPKAAEEVEIASSPRAKRARSRSPVGTVSPTRSPSKQHGRTGSSPTRR